MSTDNFIKDGTGRGYLTRVDLDNRLRTFGVTRTEFDQATVDGEAFNLNTELFAVSVTTELPVLYLKNNEARDIIVPAWFIGVDQGTLGAQNGLWRAYFSPNNVTGGTAISAVNRRSGSARSFALDARRLPTWTPTGAPVLYQTQTLNSRVFGSVFLCVPAGQSIITTVEFPTATTPFNMYTGFTGYVIEEGSL